MKAAPFLLLALGAAFTSACSDKYQTCQCIGSNGNQNSTATDIVCKAMDSGQIVNNGNGDECQGGEVMNNCDWDDFCALAQWVSSSYSSCN
jgi:hypothetical protein